MVHKIILNEGQFDFIINKFKNKNDLEIKKFYILNHIIDHYGWHEINFKNNINDETFVLSPQEDASSPDILIKALRRVISNRDILKIGLTKTQPNKVIIKFIKRQDDTKY